MTMVQVCDLFTVTYPEGLDLWVEDLGEDLLTETIYFTRASSNHYSAENSMVGSLEIISGTGELAEELIYLGVFREVITLDGFLSDGVKEDEYFGFSAQFKVDGREFRQHHSIIGTSEGYSVHIRFLQGHSEMDIDEIESMIAKATFNRSNRATLIGENIPMKFREDSFGFQIGNQSHLRVA